MAEIEKRPKPSGITVREALRRLIRHENGVLVIVVLALVAVLGGRTGGMMLTRDNAMNIVLQSSTRGVAAVGQAFVILTAGIDLSVGGLALMAMTLGASIMTGTIALPIGPLAIMLLFGAAMGALNGLSVSRIGMPALIVTLAMWQIMQGGAFQISKGATIASLPSFVSFLGAGRIAGTPIPVIIFVVVGVVAYLVLHHTTFGRSVYAVGGNPVSAWLSGIKVKNTLFWVYVISGFTAALAGMIIMGRIACASMAAAIGLELDSIASVCVGFLYPDYGKGINNIYRCSC